METKKVKMFMMFYPIDWERHVFDYTDEVNIPNKVKELQATYPTDANDITFVPWGEVEENKYNDALNWDVECLNNWDDSTPEEERKEYKAMIKGCKPRLTEKFIKGHWCIAVHEVTKAFIKDELLF